MCVYNYMSEFPLLTMQNCSERKMRKQQIHHPRVSASQRNHDIRNAPKPRLSCFIRGCGKHFQGCAEVLIK